MGPGVYICQECVGVCAGIFADEQRLARIAQPLVITVHASIEGGHEDTVRRSIEELKKRLDDAGARHRISALRRSGDGTIERI